MRLDEKVAIVTGASAGIGREIAVVFAAEGARLAIASRHRETGEPVAAQISERGGSAVFVPCDVSNESDVGELFRVCTDTYGRVDILVNNAGVNFAKPFEETEVADWDHVMGTDLRGSFLCTRLAVRSMLENGGGSIINVTSVHTLASLPGAAPYDAAKWGLVGMTKALAVEYASRGIRVNALSPGLIDTRIWQDIKDAAPDIDQCLAYWRANIPAGRVGTAREIANAAVYLASDEASYMTGANMVVDGGMTSQLISAAPYESRSLDGT